MVWRKGPALEPYERAGIQRAELTEDVELPWWLQLPSWLR